MCRTHDRQVDWHEVLQDPAPGSPWMNTRWTSDGHSTSTDKLPSAARSVTEVKMVRQTFRTVPRASRGDLIREIVHFQFHLQSLKVTKRIANKSDNIFSKMQSFGARNCSMYRTMSNFVRFRTILFCLYLLARLDDRLWAGIPPRYVTGHPS